MSNVSVIVIENSELERVLTLLQHAHIAHFELLDFFAIEGFTCLEQVESWWTDK